ncbi:uncharacterized protein PGTG_04289 [Puccinia graminis f. sp. tritici CRL 75-36-700-3]|uniref:Uncharacterized protein n=2 Tax=Puccinia graminis f. sp. tritici TaxID=56615 RepID=E3K1W4_PUCGT|nr:uncharacterized protein PGTG_04289 [Puccinia graminis f. sp. tritici CRL 75-36-700-3]EFP78333.2 hypothetical protein PGTG_04289 [Puccinia graminis f. sp. tritici CRL 75-36-700-3]
MIFLALCTFNMFLENLAMYNVPKSTEAIIDGGHEMKGLTLAPHELITPSEGPRMERYQGLHKPQEKGVSSFKLERSHQEKKLSDLKENELKLVFFPGKHGEEHIRRLKGLKTNLDGIDSANLHAWDFLHPTGPERKLWAEEQTRLDIMRGSLANILERKKVDPKPYQWVKELRDTLEPEQKSILENLWKLAKEDNKFKRNNQGFLAFFHSIWERFFKRPNWQKRQLRLSLHKIRVQLRNREVTDEQLAVLQLERIQQAGFEISQQEQKLARKIADSSQLSTIAKEQNLVKNIIGRPVAVRRKEKSQELLQKFKMIQEGPPVRRGGNSLEDLELITDALKDLGRKEEVGQSWTEFDDRLINALETEVNKVGKEELQLQQIVEILRNQKAYDVLKAKPMDQTTPGNLIFREKVMKNTEEYKSLHPDEHIDEFTEEDMQEVKQLAKQYYRMKDRLWEPTNMHAFKMTWRHFKEKLQTKEGLLLKWMSLNEEKLGHSGVGQEMVESREEIVLRWLKKTHEEKGLDTSQEKIRSKLLNGNPKFNV